MSRSVVIFVTEDKGRPSLEMQRIETRSCSVKKELDGERDLLIAKCFNGNTHKNRRRIGFVLCENGQELRAVATIDEASNWLV